MSEIVIFEEDAQKVEVRLEGETVWLTLSQLAELFGRDKSVISRHLRNIFRDFELERESVVAKNATTAADGKTYQVEHFNLDAIISVGYRVNSHRATRFRQWATTVLRHHLTRGYSLNEHRLARQGLSELEQAVEVLGQTLTRQELVSDLGQPLKPVRPIGRHIHLGRLPIHHLSEQLAGNRPHGEALVAVPEGQPQSGQAGGRADHGFHVRGAGARAHPGLRATASAAASCR